MPPNTDTANREFNNAERLDTLLPKEVGEKLDNMLVRQKDYILSTLDKGDYRAALLTLHCLREFWYAMNYGYKFEEILEKIKKQKERVRRPTY